MEELNISLFRGNKFIFNQDASDRELIIELKANESQMYRKDPRGYRCGSVEPVYRPRDHLGNTMLTVPQSYDWEGFARAAPHGVSEHF